jgi:Zn-dependent M16 (insulinase) family peptidase
MRIRANFHEADWAEEQTGGISYLWFLQKLADGFETNWPTLRAAMERIRSLLVTRAGLLCNVTTDAASWRRFEPVACLLPRCVVVVSSRAIFLADWRRA